MLNVAWFLLIVIMSVCKMWRQTQRVGYTVEVGSLIRWSDDMLHWERHALIGYSYEEAVGVRTDTQREGEYASLA